MLLVPTRIMPSSIQGFGVFAARPIPAGTAVWQYHEPVDYRRSDIPQELIAFTARYAYKPHGKEYQEFCGDGTMFMNHSNTPNLSHDRYGIGYANRAIADGEELTCDYREFDSEPESGGFLR